MFQFNLRRNRLKVVVGRAAAGIRSGGSAGSEVRRREIIQAKLKEVERQHVNRNKFDLGKALAQTGLNLTRQRFIIAAATSGVVFGLLALLLSSPFAAIFALVIGTIGLPRLFLHLAIKRRISRFTSRFAEALDVIIRGVRSGLPLGESLHIIGREMPDPIGLEFRLMTERIRLGMTMDETLAKLSERMPTPEVRFFAIVVGIQQQTGGNLAETLSKLSEVLRSRKRMRDKIQAMSSEAKASAIIIGSLPVAVMAILSLIAPDYIELLFTNTIGNVILIICACVMATGTMVMRGMINFDM